MSSFLGDLKAFFLNLPAIGQILAPEISLFDPALGATVNTISAAVLQAEVAFQTTTSGASTGAQKSAYVTQKYTASLEIVRSLEAKNGRTVTVPDNLLQDAINAEVASKNAYAALTTGITITPSPRVN